MFFMKHFINCFKRIAFLSLFIALPAQAVTGVAFVHGTGNQTNAYSDYWTGSFIQSVIRGLPNSSNYVVANCEFERYMWDSRAAGCLAGYLHNFITAKNIDNLVIITHSNGGNVVRWILSNPTYDSRYIPIINATRHVTAIAPSSLGTPLADAVVNGTVFERILGWILGYASDAVRMQRVGAMAYYNANYLLGTSGRPALPVLFKSIVGSDVESSPFDGDSYCGGYRYQVALEFTQNWLNNCSDGFLECRSQRGAGQTWLIDKHFTAGREPLSHQQSRRPCFRLDTTLRNDL